MVRADRVALLEKIGTTSSVDVADSAKLLKSVAFSQVGRQEGQFLEIIGGCFQQFPEFLLRSPKERHLHDFAKRNWKSS
jgi:hypothetical protein